MIYSEEDNIDNNDSNTIINEIPLNHDACNHSVPIAQLVSIQEEESDVATSREPTITVMGLPYVEDQDCDQGCMETIDVNNGNNLLYRKLQISKTVSIVVSIAVIMLCLTILVVTICGTTDFCSNQSSSNIRATDTNDDSNNNNDKTYYPLDHRAIEMINYINNITLSNRIIEHPLHNSTDVMPPEELALQFMIENDSKYLLPYHTNHSIRIRQRYALRTFYYATTRSRHHWTNSSGWVTINQNEIDDECMWYGVTCTSTALLNSNTSNNNTTTMMVENVVTVLDMYDNNLYGYIPSDLGLLSYLEHFDISSNQMFGSIPESMGLLTSLLSINMLRSYDLANSPLFLNGTIPNAVGNWSKLISFDITGNNFTSTLPKSMSNWNKTIEILEIASNDLSGTIPSFITSWTNLIDFNCENNMYMNGTIPNSIGNLRNLQTLRLAHNLFTGTLPSSIQYLSNFKYIDVALNSLTGTIPNGVENWTNLVSAAFNDNYFAGSMPQGICTNVSDVVVDCESTLLINCSCCKACDITESNNTN
jgi:hypothetical protein